MAGDNNIVDKEGKIDKRVKENILKARERVDRAEYDLYTQAKIEGRTGEAWKNQADASYGNVVKQYIRWLEPVLKNDQIETEEDYYESQLDEVFVIPPPNIGGYPFQELAHSNVNGLQWKMRHGLPEDLELPEPKEIKFDGLKHVIDKPTEITETWEINIGMWESPNTDGFLRESRTGIVPKEIYEEAVRKADEFRQKAGIGLVIDSGRPFANYSK